MPLVYPNGSSNGSSNYQKQFIYTNYKDYLKEKSIINLLVEKKRGDSIDPSLNLIKNYSNYSNYNNFLGCYKLKLYKSAIPPK